MIEKIGTNIQKVIINALYYHLSSNNPDQRSKNVIGINAQKYIPEVFVSFLESLEKNNAYLELIEENHQIFEVMFENYGAGTKVLIQREKEFLNYLLGLESLSQ
jgi:hypothetical protein